MLRRLSIQDFVIVTALDMEFEAGLTVFSGETGAGKSILIDALSLLCGARAEADVIRAGCARAQLSAEFELTEPARRCLAAQALDTETEPNAIQLRRAIDCNGRSRAFINGTPVALAQLRESALFWSIFTASTRISRCCARRCSARCWTIMRMRGRSRRKRPMRGAPGGRRLTLCGAPPTRCARHNWNASSLSGNCLNWTRSRPLPTNGRRSMPSTGVYRMRRI